MAEPGSGGRRGSRFSALGPGRNISGVVRDPAGKPIADVGLSARPEGEPRQFVFVKTDDQGRYRLDNLPLDVTLDVSLAKLE